MVGPHSVPPQNNSIGQEVAHAGEWIGCECYKHGSAAAAVPPPPGPGPAVRSSQHQELRDLVSKENLNMFMTRIGVQVAVPVVAATSGDMLLLMVLCEQQRIVTVLLYYKSIMKRLLPVCNPRGL